MLKLKKWLTSQWTQTKNAERFWLVISNVINIMIKWISTKKILPKRDKSNYSKNVLVLLKNKCILVASYYCSEKDKEYFSDWRKWTIETGNESDWSLDLWERDSGIVDTIPFEKVTHWANYNLPKKNDTY